MPTSTDGSRPRSRPTHANPLLREVARMHRLKAIRYASNETDGGASRRDDDTEGDDATDGIES